MARPRAPWWMYVAAASFLAAVALICYQALWGPTAAIGFAADFRSGGMTVSVVHPNSPAERAGLEPHDRVLSVDGQIVRNTHDWQAILANVEWARPKRLEVLRGGMRLQLALATPPISWSEGRSRHIQLPYLSVVLTSFVLALVIAFSRPYDPVARMGAWVIATASIALGFPPGWAATWRHLPTLLGVLLWIPQISRFVFDAILFTFFTIFPGRLFRARWPWILLWTPVLVELPWRISAAYPVVYQPGHATGAPEWIFSTTLIRTFLYLPASLVALAVNYRRLEDINQRRRVRVLVAGAVSGSLAAIVFVVTFLLVPANPAAPTLEVVTLLLCLAFPLSFAYALLRHRLFDIRLIIRQGVQYALARGVLLSLVPALAAILVIDLVVHGEQPLLAILESRGWVYAALGGLGLLAHAKRRRWLEALDRRFFRERYDAQRLLREVAEEVREAHSFERVAPRVVARIEAALHPEFVALLVREPREASYRTVTAAPSGQAPPPLPADSKLVALVRVLGKPLEVSLTESGWLKQQLPHEETDFLRQARIDLLVPIAVGAERTEALLALGFKRSEEPYSREDQDLLMAIAASLSLLLEMPAVALPSRMSEALEECPKCGSCHDTGAARCAKDGSSLIPVRLPRMLSGRYRLERRLGRGGMGAVYEATDTALERRVAVKVIRDDLVGSAEAAERFRREARAAASFSHPNVVTVHDFGVADTRAFLVMELLDGKTLREELQRERHFPPARTVEILRGVCEAVDAAHRRQLIHRDLKPENIFLARAETAEIAKVLDFGIAKFLPTATQATADTGAGLLVGTMHYMSPEQLVGQAADAGWDLWALAVVAYEMLAGAQPFTIATPAEWQSAVLAGRFTPLERHLPEAPARWKGFFARVFAPDKVERPSSARVLFAELEKAFA